MLAQRRFLLWIMPVRRTGLHVRQPRSRRHGGYSKMRSICFPVVFLSYLTGLSPSFLSSAANAQSVETTDYEYDALGRLISVDRATAGKKMEYSFDDAGNRATVTQTTLPPSSFSVSDVSVTEGGMLTFVVAKTAGPAQSYNVNYATTNGSAGAGDYTSRSGVLAFGPTDNSKSVTVQTTPDSLFENPETVLLNLSNPTNGATIADTQGVGTISNDDAAPQFSINNPSVSEGGNLNFNVTKSGQTALTHAVTFSTANGSAAAGSDYTARPSVTLTFHPTRTSRLATVVTTEDTIAEPNETVLGNLSNPTGGAVIADNQGVGTILNDDNAPPVTINDSVTVNEGAGRHVYVLNNDSDPENDPLTISSVSILSGSYAFSATRSCSNKCIQIIGLSDGAGSVRYFANDGNSSTAGTLFVKVIGGSSLD